MQITPDTPKTTIARGFKIWTSVGTESVRLQGNEVIGRWGERLRSFTGLKGRLLVEDFVNWSRDPDDIVRFTSAYGPLDAEPREGTEFRFSVQHWKNLQSNIQSLWEGRAGRSGSTTMSGASYDISIQNQSLVFLAKTLDAFLLMELATAPAARLRKCLRPDCPNPYFMARHLKQQYCSPECAEWAQAQWKKKWWHEKGSGWLRSQKKRRSRKARSMANTK